MKLFSQAAAALVVLAVCASAMPRPESPLTLFVADRMRALARTAAPASDAFTGTYKGTFDQFGTKGTFAGDFSGKARGGEAQGRFTGRAGGRCNSMGAIGAFSVDYSGQFSQVTRGRDFFFAYRGLFDFEFKGTYNGLDAFAKAVGSFTGRASPKGMRATEKGRFLMRAGGKQVQGWYSGFFDGKTFGAKFRGTFDGKKFAFKYKFFLENAMDLMKSEGEYSVTSGGKTVTGKFNSTDMMLPKN